MAKKKQVDVDEDGVPVAAKKSKKKLIIIVVLVLALAGGGYMFLGKGKSASAAEKKPVPGAVVALEPIHVNLAGGHYLKLGMALQATIDAHEAPDGSHALDIAIQLFSGKTVAELADEKERDTLKKELVKEVGEAYEHEVMDIYFTEFVTQ